MTFSPGNEHIFFSLFIIKELKSFIILLTPFRTIENETNSDINY